MGPANAQVEGQGAEEGRDRRELPRPWGESTRPWSPADIQRWWSEQKIVRSFEADVLARLRNLPDACAVENYGPASQPYWRIRVGSWDSQRPKILISGGVHGYEKGGVDAALEFAEKHAPALGHEFDIAIFPCVHPDAYERNTRWNFRAQDTNRHCTRNAASTPSGQSAPECEAFMDGVDEIDQGFALAIDLHETTNHDIYLRELKMWGDGKTEAPDDVIPQGFYLVMNTDAQESPAGRIIVDSVRKATKIAAEPEILGVRNQDGVIYLDPAQFPGLCMNFTSAPIRVTTEVYPDIITPAEALAGQIAAIFGGIEALRARIRGE